MNEQNLLSDMKWVDGLQGVNGANVAFGHVDHFFDSREDYMYVKAVGFNGIPQPVRRFKLVEDPIPENGFDLPSNVVTEEKLNDLLDKKFEEFMEKMNSQKKQNNRNNNYRKNNHRYDREEEDHDE